MSEKALERQQFAERLKHAMQEANLRPGASSLTKTFNTITGLSLTVHAIRKWLTGEAVPTQEKLKQLADILGCDPAWLRFGSGLDTISKPEISVLDRTLITQFNQLAPYERSAVRALITGLLLSKE